MRFTTQRKVRSPRVMMVREVRTSIPLGTYRSGTSQLKAMSETFSRLRTIPRTLTAAAARTSLPFRSRAPWAKPLVNLDLEETASRALHELGHDLEALQE